MTKLAPIGTVARRAIMRRAGEYRRKGLSSKTALKKAWADAKRARRRK